MGDLQKIIDHPEVGSEGGPKSSRESVVSPDVETQYRALFELMAEGALLHGADG